MGSVKPATAGRDGSGTVPGTAKGPGQAAGQFGRGRDPLERVKRVEDSAGSEAVVVGVAGRLAVMQKVLGQRKCDDRGSTERVLREWLERDARGYLRELTVMEDRLAGQGGGSVEEADEGKDRAEAACERLLGAWAKGERT